jgi:hypothetical protein
MLVSKRPGNPRRLKDLLQLPQQQTQPPPHVAAVARDGPPSRDGGSPSFHLTDIDAGFLPALNAKIDDANMVASTRQWLSRAGPKSPADGPLRLPKGDANRTNPIHLPNGGAIRRPSSRRLQHSNQDRANGTCRSCPGAHAHDGQDYPKWGHTSWHSCVDFLRGRFAWGDPPPTHCSHANPSRSWILQTSPFGPQQGDLDVK